MKLVICTWEQMQEMAPLRDSLFAYEDWCCTCAKHRDDDVRVWDNSTFAVVVLEDGKPNGFIHRPECFYPGNTRATDEEGNYIEVFDIFIYYQVQARLGNPIPLEKKELLVCLIRGGDI